MALEDARRAVDGNRETGIAMRLRTAKAFAAGAMSVPVSVALYTKLPTIWIPLLVFAGSALGFIVASFVDKSLSSLTFSKCVQDSVEDGAYFLYGGAPILAIGLLIEDPLPRSIAMVFMTALVCITGIDEEDDS